MFCGWQGDQKLVHSPKQLLPNTSPKASGSNTQLTLLSTALIIERYSCRYDELNFSPFLSDHGFFLRMVAVW